jgi:outer membrane protein OmpA-like peptidoglycan-associated protein/tetratricopeptide (TPR) repeat protein
MKIKITILLFISIISSVFSQKVKLDNANKEYDNYAYIDAIEIYEEVAKKGFKSVDLFQKLGNSNYFNANFNEAAKWYEELFKLNEEVTPEYYYRYAQALKSLGDYKKADEYLSLFSLKNSSDSRTKLFNENKNYLSQIKEISNRYKIEDSGINTEYSDFGAAFVGDNFVFTSTRDTGSVAKIRHKWTNQSFSNLYSATVTSDGLLIDPKKMHKSISSKFNESTAVFTRDGQTMYFTRNNFINGKKGTNQDEIILLKIYKAKKVGASWGEVEELPFNSNSYSCAHPALSPENDILYFSSNMPGTLGQSDIFKVVINEDGSFGQPENLGPVINTEARETFPFVSDENELFFSSDGQLGLGGLDIFAVKMYENGDLSKVYNLGEPVNGTQDDFSYIIDSKTKFGFFSSNREGGKGNDDIYKFKEEIPLPYNYKQLIAGEVLDEETEEVIPNALVEIFDAEMNLIDSQRADEYGNYKFKDLKPNTKYVIKAQSKTFETIEKAIVTNSTNGETLVSTVLPKKQKKITKGSNLATTFGIKLIYFDLDKSNIREDASVELAKILEVMKKYPTMKVDVRSHTDSRQSSRYNEILSERRAQSTIKWLIDNGIEPSRLTGKGYGESILLNRCKDGVNCSEEEHQVNRRSDFIIIEM